MADLKIIEIQTITKEAITSINFLEQYYPYVEEYEELNNAILEKSKLGINFIDFDFIDNEIKGSEKIDDIYKNYRRIYPHYGSCNALYNTFNYPLYLISKGFNVEVRKSLKKHGYVSKSYHVTW
jgi:hypothetical protein